MTIIIYISLLAILLLLLYIFQRRIIDYFSHISLLVFGTEKIGIYLFFLFFLPGVILHELSHLFMALIMGVPTGQMTIFPQDEGEKGWSLGKVASAKTDPLRGGLIGLAPMVVGGVSLVLLKNLIFNDSGVVTSFLPRMTTFSVILASVARPESILMFYLLLVFANTMFLSSEDRKTIWVIPGLFIIFGLASYIAGWVGVLQSAENLFLQIVRPLVISLGLTVLIDFIFLIPLVILMQIILRIKLSSRA